MLVIDANGAVIDGRIKLAIRPAIERGAMPQVRGIIVHQTASASAAGTLKHYTTKKSNGAHFLIDKDGSIYQTASVLKQTWHVGILKSRCLSERTCAPAEFKRVSKLSIHPLSRHELRKSWPDRYPTNQDAIGIELVGQYLASTGKFEMATAAQNASLHWLVGELAVTLGVSLSEIFRHPDVSYKKPSEAASARW